MLKWDISYQDTFTCSVDNTVFKIYKNLDNKYNIYVTLKIGDEFFDKTLYDLETLQKANTMCEGIYERMNRK